MVKTTTKSKHLIQKVVNRQRAVAVVLLVAAMDFLVGQQDRGNMAILNHLRPNQNMQPNIQ